MSFDTNNPAFWHVWSPGYSSGMPVDMCRCGVIRNMDGSNDHCLCHSAIFWYDLENGIV